jgi:hypothetical protein
MLERIKRAVLAGTLTMLVLLLLVYTGDYVALRFQISRGRPQFGQISVDTLWAIHQKNGKTTYQVGQPEISPCVHSLFPHYGHDPCWYVSRHTEKRIDI